jgi:molybdopterin converting factor small subunit
MVRVLLFAGLRPSDGQAHIDYPWHPGLTIGTIRERLGRDLPASQPLLARSRAACDDQIVEDSLPVPDGAQIAFLPPVSGG